MKKPNDNTLRAMNAAQNAADVATHQLGHEVVEKPKNRRARRVDAARERKEKSRG